MGARASPPIVRDHRVVNADAWVLCFLAREIAAAVSCDYCKATFATQASCLRFARGETPAIPSARTTNLRFGDAVATIVWLT